MVQKRDIQCVLFGFSDMGTHRQASASHKSKSENRLALKKEKDIQTAHGKDGRAIDLTARVVDELLVPEADDFLHRARVGVSCTS